MISSTSSHLGSISVPKYTLYPFSEVPGKTWFREGIVIKEINDNDAIIDLHGDSIEKTTVGTSVEAVRICQESSGGSTSALNARPFLEHPAHTLANTIGIQIGPTQSIDHGNEEDNELFSEHDNELVSEHDNEQGIDQYNELVSEHDNEQGSDHGNEMGGDQGNETGSDQDNKMGSDEVEVSDHDDVNIKDEGHIIDEVEVNVKGFRFSVEEDVVHEPLHPKVNVKENGLEILDFDSFDSDVGDDSNSARRAALRNLKKE
ncbi:hypothetical protein Tco_0090385 [Tanacetum coccineum]